MKLETELQEALDDLSTIALDARELFEALETHAIDDTFYEYEVLRHAQRVHTHLPSLAGRIEWVKDELEKQRKGDQP